MGCEANDGEYKNFGVHSPLSDEDIAFLNDLKLKTDSDTGVVSSVKDNKSLTEDIKTTRKIMRRAKGCEAFNIDFSSAEADQFLAGIGVRNRLTHPKRFGEMNVSDEEMKVVEEGVRWLTTNLQNFADMYRSVRKQGLDENFEGKIEDARQLGVDESVITNCIKQVRPSYKPPKLPFAYTARTVRRPTKGTRRRT